MHPRDLLTFFKTRTGRLVGFGALFAAGLTIFSTLRNTYSADESMPPVSALTTNETDQAQTIKSIERTGEPFRPPTPKPESKPAVQPPKPEPPKVVAEQAVAKVPPPAPPPLPPISLLTDTTAGVAEPKMPGDSYAPFGRLISCETVVTVDSSSIQTPIIGLITEDIYHAGRLIIPAGTEVHGTAQTDRHRERIASSSSWTLVWQTGEELRLKAIALDREFAGDQEGWGITDGSAGLRGRILKSDDLAEIKMFAATFLSGAAGALTEKEQTIFGSVDSRTLNNAPLKGAQEVLAVYADRIRQAIERDGFYVRVPTGKQFYLYVLQTIDRAAATVAGTTEPFVSSTDSITTTPTP